MAASSSSPRLYDVFVNHQGPSGQGTVAFQLCKSLRDRGFLVFDPNELDMGNFSRSVIQNAIHSAPVHVAIFSKEYADSPSCLMDLYLMLETKSKIIPVFDDVEPWHLRHNEKGVYAKALVGYEQNGRDELKMWKDALSRVSYIFGCDSQNNHDLQDMCEKMVLAVSKVLKQFSDAAKYVDEGEVENIIFPNVAKDSVGLDKALEDFERYCLQEREDSNIVGIFGSEASGKKTMAKELYNRKRSRYNGSCFLTNVREVHAQGKLISLQRELLNELFHQNHPNFETIEEETTYLRDCMKRGRSLRFLIVLDDVDNLDQLNALLDIDALNCGSRVIVTSRDEQLLTQAGISARYRIQEMDEESSTHLFCWHAFDQPYPAAGYDDLVHSFVKQCGGFPLSLRVLGKHLCGRDLNFWKSEWDKFELTLPTDIKHTLKISLDSLASDEKQVFMDITCFFLGKPKDMAVQIWKRSEWMAEHILQVLQNKFLLRFDDNNNFRVYDLLCALGREMAEEFMSPLRLWRPCDLKCLELMGFCNTFCELRGRNVRCLGSMFDESMRSQITFFFGKADDCGETSTALLWLDICYYGENFTSIPSWIPVENLEQLKFEIAMPSELEKRNYAVQSEL